MGGFVYPHPEQPGERQATITTADGTIHYVYDEATGNLVETWTAANATATHSSAQNDVLYGYDNQGRLESVTQVVLNGSTPPAVSGGTRYDADGNAIATTEPTTVYTYDAAGNLLSDAEPNGDTTSYTYNHLEQITDESITNAAGKLLFAEHTDWYDDGDKKDVVDTRGDGAGNVTSQITYVWTYDNDDRLIGEALTVQIGSGTSVPTPYADTFAYDLDNNRVSESEAPAAGQAATETIAYTYNGDDQLKTEIGTGTSNYTTQYGYDADGNLTSLNRTGDGAEANTYGYDLRNRMVTADVAGVTTTYTYDYNGILTSETTAGTTTYDLNDPNNPTGYSKAIQQSSAPGGAPTISYVLGLRVEAQCDTTNGPRYLLVDGHGSTRALADTTGAVVAGQTFDYSAFGTTLTNAAGAQTVWQFGGDGLVDHATGWRYHLDRWTDGFEFTSVDSFSGVKLFPVTLPRYTYVGENPIAFADPSGDVLLGVVSAAAADDETDAEDAALGQIARSDAEELVGDAAGEQADVDFAAETQDAIGENGGLDDDALNQAKIDEAAEPEPENPDSEPTNYEWHHPKIQQFYGRNSYRLTQLTQQAHRALHRLIANAIDEAFAGKDAPSAINGSAALWQQFFANNKGSFEIVDGIVKTITKNALGISW